MQQWGHRPPFLFEDLILKEVLSRATSRRHSMKALCDCSARGQGIETSIWISQFYVSEPHSKVTWQIVISEFVWLFNNKAHFSRETIHCKFSVQGNLFLNTQNLIQSNLKERRSDAFCLRNCLVHCNFSSEELKVQIKWRFHWFKLDIL